MKTWKRILLSSLTLLPLTGCTDLRQEPLSFLTPENIAYDEANITNLANGLYRSLWHWNYGYCCRLFTLTLGADDVIAGQLSKARVIVIDELRADPTISELDVQYFWQNMYSLVLNANLLIEGIDASEYGNLTEKERKAYMGEAYFMRAFAYYNLVRIFGDVPAVVNSQSTEDVLGNKAIGRNTVADIYDRIIVPDLKKAEEYLPEQPRTGDNSSVGKIAAQTCLAEVYLTMAGWPLKRTACYALAADKAREIIQAPYNKHRLTDHYADLWREVLKSDNTEHIFAVNCSRLNSMASQYGISFLAVEENGWSDYLADEVFYLRYPDDERKAWNYQTTYSVAGKPKPNSYKQSAMKSPFIKKYRDYGTDAAQSDGIIPIYRYADVLLIYAEAQNMAAGGPDELAYKCLNDVRRRASGGIDNNAPDGLTCEEFDRYVFDERGWEFFAEYKRWFQLVRREKVEECNRDNPRVAAAGHIDRNQQNYLMPLPPKQVELCHFPQNAGY
ncbi:MAG: RagB/SusD family nutrient uptake outer membrane protein [Bacteroidaceae bacterium]